MTGRATELTALCIDKHQIINTTENRDRSICSLPPNTCRQQEPPGSVGSTSPPPLALMIWCVSSPKELVGQSLIRVARSENWSPGICRKGGQEGRRVERSRRSRKREASGSHTHIILGEREERRRAKDCPCQGAQSAGEPAAAKSRPLL